VVQSFSVKIASKVLPTRSGLLLIVLLRASTTFLQLKETLEGIAENLFVQDPYLQSGGDMVRMGGLDYTIDPAQSLGNRISNIVDDGTDVPQRTPADIAKSASCSSRSELTNT
jgi:hypothetical protein